MENSTPKARSLKVNFAPSSKQGGFSLLEVMVAMGVAAVLTYAISQMLMNSGKQAASIASKGDFNSLVNQLQGAFNNTATCAAALSPLTGPISIPNDPSKYPMAAQVTIGNKTYAKDSHYGGPADGSKRALTIKSLEFEKITSAGTTNVNQFVVPLNLQVDRSVNGATAVGGNLLTKSFSLLVTLAPEDPLHKLDPRKIIGCAGQYTDLWVTTNDTDIVYTGGQVGIGICNPTSSPPGCIDPPTPLGASLDVAGTIQGTAFMYRSDMRLKENIREIPSALERVLKLHGVLFDWKNPVEGRDHLGFLAQEVEKVFPEAVNTNPNSGLKTVGYGNLLAPLIEAFKEQKEIILRQQKEIEELKKAVLQKRGTGT